MAGAICFPRRPFGNADADPDVRAMVPIAEKAKAATLAFILFLPSPWVRGSAQ